ncbi:28S ribosomal protein S31, mitochondrial [Elysia marginata]|uniref:Small ribosomal subunit protein mS31 n=1 Tax=Elysia marginata TaxID=1093978 RepID=A0AAV4ERH6_9GAST|nr:28S ribosomal protein S31, mitochondrial [Elysia marginata]
MLRSTVQCVSKVRLAFLQRKTQPRSLSKILKLSSSVRQLSLSAQRCADQKKRRPTKVKVTTSTKEDMPVSSEVQEAAVQAAKSLPGDWTKTAEELLARLQTKTAEAEPRPGADEPPNGGARSLLSTMKVGRSFEGGREVGRKKGGRRVQRLEKEDSLYSKTVVEKAGGDSNISRQRMRTPVFKDLYGVPRLGIFEAKKTSEVPHDQASTEGAEDLWATVEKEHVRKLQGGLPRNAFEEMIRLTEQGKVWTFPIDNEADLHEERKYKFHDHVFLERHLTEFPRSGPIRKFMELVTLGLSQNPWLSVPEKVEHIAWFSQYFREKQDVLESALGEEGHMKEGESVKEDK